MTNGDLNAGVPKDSLVPDFRYAPRSRRHLCTEMGKVFLHEKLHTLQKAMSKYFAVLEYYRTKISIYFQDT